MTVLVVITQSLNHTLQNEAASSSFSAGKENGTGSDRISLVEVLSELRNLLEDYSPAWYTEEHRTRVELALRLGENESNHGVGIMCFERKRLLHDEDAAWNEFRRVRDLKSSSDCEIVQSHDMAIESSRRLRAHFAACEDCKECKRI